MATGPLPRFSSARLRGEIPKDSRQSPGDDNSTEKAEDVLLAMVHGTRDEVAALWPGVSLVSLSASRDSGRNALHWACLGGYEQIATEMLESGLFDPNGATLGLQLSCVSLAASAGHLGIVRLLLSYGAVPLQRDKSNETALHDVCMQLRTKRSRAAGLDSSPAESHETESHASYEIIRLLLRAAGHSQSLTAADRAACTRDLPQEVAMILSMPPSLREAAAAAVRKLAATGRLCDCEAAARLPEELREIVYEFAPAASIADELHFARLAATANAVLLAPLARAGYRECRISPSP